MPLEKAFDIHTLGSEVLTKLYHEVNSSISGIRIEVLPARRGDRWREKHPAATVGLPLGKPTIQFSGSLNRINRIEAIAHELVHLLLVYRYGLGVIGRRIPRYGNSDDVFYYFMSMSGNWEYLLGQLANTAHHLILIDYLKQRYGFESRLHLHLLNHHFSIAANHNDRDKESLYAKGLIAFEYERLIGKVDQVVTTSSQAQSFWKAYEAAQKYLGGYSSESIPSPAAYKEDILSLLEELGYQKETFIFFP
jgi:hypothetical protein